MEENLGFKSEATKLKEMFMDVHCVNRDKKKRRRNHKKAEKNVQKCDEGRNGDCSLNSVLEQLDLNANEDWKLSIRAILGHSTGTVIKKSERQYVNSKFYSSTNIPIVHVTKSPVKYEGVRAVVLEEDRNSGTMNFDLEKSTKNADLQPSSSGRKKIKQKRVENRKTPEQLNAKFEEFWKIEDVDEGLLSGSLIKGVLRVNRKNNQQSFVTHNDGTCKDYLITSVRDRNRALDGDVVVLKLKPSSEWEGDYQTAFVVYIYEKVHSRIAVGIITVLRKKGHQIISLQPRDNRIPRITIKDKFVHDKLKSNPEMFENRLFKAIITEWNNVKFAVGEIIECIGRVNDLEAETEAILQENNLDVGQFPETIMRHIPKYITAEEYERREDMRRLCIFTIDPSTARDLDDAVSCRRLPNGNFEVGVHIADVTHFLTPDTELDRIVSAKATSVYLVNRVYNMLPPEMCSFLSLLPGKDSLTFSVIWELTVEGKVVSHRFCKSVINSCCQLSYENALAVLDDPAEFNKSTLPQIHNGFSANDIYQILNDLKVITQHLQQARLERGALRINNVKLAFQLDQENEPVNISIYRQTKAHYLIEELMLLTNITVAEKINKDFPDIAFLRYHEPPISRLLIELKTMLETVGVHVDVSSSKSIQSDLLKYSSSYVLDTARSMVLYHLFSKPMRRACYCCAMEANVDSFEHYALNVPLYTHFTSPIRRYADIVVHRLLSASLGYVPVPKYEAEYFKAIAKNCNVKKYSAKIASDNSSDLYLARYIERHQPFIQNAAVIKVSRNYFDVLVLNTGSVVRIYNDRLFDVNVTREEFKNMYRLTLTYPATDHEPVVQQIVELFQIVRVGLKKKKNSYSLEGVLLKPLH